MTKTLNYKNIAQDLIREYGHADSRKIIRELSKQLDLFLIKIYYSGDLDESKKEIISSWISKKITGYYETEYIHDEELISGLKIVYRDFEYEDSLASNIKKLLWTK